MSLPVRIVSVGTHTPAVRVTSEALDELYGRPPGSTSARSGVLERRWIAPDETTVSMTGGALAQALDRGGLTIDDLDALIVTGIVPEQPLPTTAILVAAQLGVADGALEAFDVNASCLGFLVGLQQAAFGIAAGRWKRVAVAATDIASKGLNHSDLETSALFGDGAAAAVVETASMVETASLVEPVETPEPRSSDPGFDTLNRGSEILALRLRSYPSAANLCRILAGGTRWNTFTPPPERAEYMFAMDGLGMMKLVTREFPGFLDDVLDEAGVTRDQLDVIVPHQASSLGLRFLRERLGMRPDTVVDILAERGNQVSASLPTALASAVESGRLRRGQLCLLLGTGAGLLFGAAVLRF